MVIRNNEGDTTDLDGMHPELQDEPTTVQIDSTISLRVKGRSILVRDIFRYAPASILPAVISVMTWVIFTRIFKPQSYGVLMLVNAVVAPFVAACSQVLGQPVGRFYTEVTVDGELAVFKSVIRRFITWILVGGLITVVIGVLGRMVISGFESITMFMVIGVIMGSITQIVVAILSPILPSANDASAYRRLQIGNSLLGFAISYGLVKSLGPHIVWMVWGSTLTTIIMILPLFQWVRRHVGEQTEKRDRDFLVKRRRELTWRFVRFGAPMMVWFVSASLMDTSDRYVIGAFFGTKAVALYGSSYTIATQAISLLSGPLVMATWPRVMRLWGEKRAVAPVRDFLRQATNLYLLIGIGLLGGTAVVGSDVVRILLGPGYQEGGVVLVPVMAGGLLWGMSMIGHKSMEISERNDLMMWNASGAAVMNIILNLLLVPRLGWAVAAYTTLCSYLFYAMVTWKLARRMIPWDIPWTNVSLYIGSAVLDVVMTVMIPLGHTNSFIELFIRGPVFCVLYLVFIALSLRIKAFTSKRTIQMRNVKSL